MTHQLLAHQEQFAWELGYPLNSLHQVPNYLKRNKRTEVGTSDTQARSYGSVAAWQGDWYLCSPLALTRVPTSAALVLSPPFLPTTDTFPGILTRTSTENRLLQPGARLM